MSLFIGDEQDEPVDTARLGQLAAAVLKAEGLPADCEMAVILVSADQIAEYNRQFMDREGATDVLAFPLQNLEAGKVPPPVANQPPLSLGDVFLCPAEIKRHAAREKVDFEDYLCLLAVHGILHLLGYDHDDHLSARRMEEREEELLAMIGRGLS
ncbi:MAG TPA: rRNA maturation RNase YbeY [Acidimicrobiia bacterium]|nr:rRNA maturation RNase YbeY [Acidimicrobiia bacterium]